jgi:class 3 adenylate cyclase/tetratricopeptide (TPR) repeat protein/ribosomal protein L40E
MRCVRCHADNPADAKFCGRCGASLGLACPSCGAVNPPENKFCGQCGASLDTPGLADSVAPEPYLPKPVAAPISRPSGRSLPGEMKQVTVLFCDIVDSTPLTERLGPEAMRDLVNSFLETSLAEVRRYGGTAPQFSGDGFMALFGAPLAQEDHVRRALLAAVAIQHALGTSAVGADRPDLAVRIGIHTGPVVFGPVGGGLAMDPTAIGDTANLAARLQQATEPGTILLSEATHLLAQGYAGVEPVGALALKGKVELIPAYRLLGVSHRRFALDASMAPRPTVFVGRGGDLAMLNDFLAHAEGGQGRAIGVVGEPGIGKSRLLAEFRRQIPEGRITWVEGRCLSYGTQMPYLLVLDVLRSNCGISETDTPEVIAEKVRGGLKEVGIDPDVDGSVLLDVLGIKDVANPPAPSNPELVKSKTFEVLRNLCIKGSQRRLLALVLEDLHWIDNISEEFFGFLVDDLPATRVLLLSTYRPGYRPPWIEKSYARQIALQPLSRDDSVWMVRSILNAEPRVDLVTEEIVAKADGNPLFLEQLALHANDLRSELMVPNTIHDVVMARIDRLQDQTKQLLQTASVIGREFSRRLLSAAWNGSGSLEDRLHELSRLEFVYERAESDGIVYGFRHALTRETAYGSLLAQQRRAHHGAVGHALEELYAGRAEEVAEMLALHFGRSDEAEGAVDYAILAGEKSQRRWANNEALTYFNDALHRLDAMADTPPNRLRRIDAVLKQAEVEYALGRYTEQVQALEAIRGIVNESDPRRRAAWFYWTGFLHSTSGGRPELAIEHCREAAKIAAASGLDELNALAQSGLTQVYMVAGRLRDAIEAGERALSIFEARGNRWMAARTLWHLTSVANCLGTWEASLGYCNRGLQHGIALDDLRFKVVGWTRTGSAHIQRGDAERGIRCCNEALALSPIPRDAAWARVVRGYGMIKAGCTNDGITELNGVLPWFESARMQWTHLIGSTWLAEGYLHQGNPAFARPLIENVLKKSRETGYLHYEGRACWLMSECIATEAPDAAEDYAETATLIFQRVGARNDLAKAMFTRSALRQRAGDVATARRLLGQACEIFQTLGTLDEPARVKAALSALDRGSSIPLLAGAS